MSFVPQQKLFMVGRTHVAQAACIHDSDLGRMNLGPSPCSVLLICGVLDGAQVP